MSMASVASISTAGTPNFGKSGPLSKHEYKKRTNYSTPPPGHYDVAALDMTKFKTPAITSFGGNLSKVDREKTGLRAEALKNASLPGPDQYSVDAAKGRLQCSSKSARSPTFRFGSSTRGDSSRLYISKRDTGNIDANRLSAGRGVPGPGTYSSNNLASKPKSPSHSFGLRVSTNEQRPSTSVAVGPGSYRSLSSMGAQATSLRPSSSSFSMGSATREKVAEVLSPGFSPKSKSITPAPDRYGTPSALGRQTSSTAKSAAGYTFGTGKLNLAGKKNLGNPGPGEYDWNSTLGIQTTSRYKTSGGFKFGTSERLGLEKLQ